MKRIILALLSMAGVGALLGFAAVFYAIHIFSQNLPDYRQLARYEPPISTRIHAGDGRLIEEFAAEKRVFVPVEAIPKKVISAFLSAEDQNFYTHPGIDFTSIARAIAINIQNIGRGRRPVGGSTITQQVAKNFLVGNETSYKRKIREAIIAFRIEKTFSKDQILELYLNEIYLGKGHYGVAAAAMGYFNKDLNELSLAELAYLAALPKAPNNYQVENHAREAKERRDWVIGRLFEDGHISREQMKAAQYEPLVLNPQKLSRSIDARYFNEDIRRELSARYGERALYEGGLSVRSTLDPHLQRVAAAALTAGLVRYDRRHGWRGPVAHMDDLDRWAMRLASVEKPKGAKKWDLAVVLGLDAKNASIGIKGGRKGVIPLSELTWARKVLPKGGYGPAIKKPADTLQKGDIVLVSAKKAGQYALRQIPKVQGGIIAMDPHTGRILAMQGGFDYETSEFNRATQALRQPGSSFKPFVYIAALSNGFTPSNLVLDGPVELSQGPGQDTWKPENYQRDYLGLVPLRRGMELSRNTMTVRLADYIGMKAVADVAKKFHVFDNLPPYLSMGLGSGETTLLRMVTGYGMIVNGGMDITPTLIDRIQDRYGATIYRHDARPCAQCGDRIAWKNQTIPLIAETREPVVDPRVAYQMTSILEGVVQRGTATLLRDVGRPVAGKTGTTNDYKDAWFIGFTPDLVVGTYVGFDEPQSLGEKETGGRTAAPIVRAFLKVALEGQPATPFRVPENVSLVKIDPYTGKRADPTNTKAIWEAFLPGTEPGENMVQLDSADIDNAYQDPDKPEPPAHLAPPMDAAPDMGTGGLY
jgi:penicillin-binding protein 1A